MFEIFTKDISFNKNSKNNSDEYSINIMSGNNNEPITINNEKYVLLDDEIEYNDVKPVSTSHQRRADPSCRNKNIMNCTNQYKLYSKKCTINIADTVEIYPPTQTLEENVLNENSWLDDRPLNEIMKIIENNTEFHRVDVLFINALHWIDPTFTQDVQIVGGDQAGNHWHCIYYDGIKLHIYDSLYFATYSYDNLTLSERNYIKKRYPNLTKNNIIFEKVTKQPYLTSCGIFAAAFAVSIALGENPSNKTYSRDIQKMRRHCLKVIKKKILLPFPEE
ncbi:hypothetical protein ACS0PU_005797 [Formica fusca]